MDTRSVRQAKKNYMNRVMNTVKFMNKPGSVSKTNIRATRRFRRELAGLPIYYINGHACLCDIEGPCMGEEKPPFFAIPNDTYFLHYGEAGDYSCLTERAILKLVQGVRAIRRFLASHSASNVQNSGFNNSGASLFGDLRRATQRRNAGDPILYPNMNYSFNPDEKGTPRSSNPHGVYRIDTGNVTLETIVNTNSIIEQNPKKSNWFLADIVEEVYAKTGNRSGIFINGGCLSSCKKAKQIGPHIDEAGRIMAYAHAMYPTVRETLTLDEMLAENVDPAENVRIKYKFSRIHPAAAAQLVKNGLVNAESMLADRNIWADENDVRAFKEAVNYKNV